MVASRGDAPAEPESSRCPERTTCVCRGRHLARTGTDRGRQPGAKRDDRLRSCRAAESRYPAQPQPKKWMAFPEEFKMSGWSASTPTAIGRSDGAVGLGWPALRRQVRFEGEVPEVAIDELASPRSPAGTRLYGCPRTRGPVPRSDPRMDSSGPMVWRDQELFRIRRIRNGTNGFR